MRVLPYFNTWLPFLLKNCISLSDLYNGKSVCYSCRILVAAYLNWINGFALKNPVLLGDETAWQHIDDVKAFYKEADKCMINFLAQYTEYNTRITGYIESKEQNLTVTVLQLYTHVITHEFHHKGILLAMTRELGYTPVDTDIIRF